MTAVGESTAEDHVFDRATAKRARAVSAARSASTPYVQALAPGERAQASLRAGDVLGGRYTLLSSLGEGGMGDVWLAHNPTLDIQVALKVLRFDASQPALRAEMSQRLLQEARATAKLDHPAIVRIIDFGETSSGNGFYVMELLEGEDLYALLKRHGPLSAAKAVRTLLPIASALVATHGKKIVHRDLKPENIFLARDHEQNTVQPKLIDFGVAKVRVANERITVAGAVMGSPGYMAPEQARGEDADERADVWGFSVVLYETIAGRLPFEGKNFYALMNAIIEDAPAPITRLGVGDEVLSSIIERGLEKDPGKRWQTMRDFGSALAEWLLQNGVTEDICGTRLATTWMRASETGIDGCSQQDPFLSASIPSQVVIDEARRQRSEMLTVEPLVATPASDPTSARPSFLKSRSIAIAAIAIALGGGIAAGAWSLRRTAEAAQAREPGGEVSFPLAAEAIVSALAAPLQPTSQVVQPTRQVVSSQPAEPLTPSASPEPARPLPRANAAGALPKPKPSAVTAQRALGAESARPSSVLKNPF